MGHKLQKRNLSGIKRVIINETLSRILLRPTIKKDHNSIYFYIGSFVGFKKGLVLLYVTVYYCDPLLGKL